MMKMSSATPVYFPPEGGPQMLIPHQRMAFILLLVPAAAFIVLCCLAGSACAQESEPEGAELSPRQKEILRGVKEYAPWDCPDRWLYELGGLRERDRTIRQAMLEANSWIYFLAYAALLEWNAPEAKGNLDWLTEKLPALESGKIRQNVIFLVALAAPDAKQRLRKIIEATDKKLTREDRTDAGCALAMLGDEKAAEWFEKEFKGSECMLGRPVFSFGDYVSEEEKDNREVTLSYRTWEVLFRRPYFRYLQFLARTNLYSMHKPSVTQDVTDKLARRFLPLFPAKWPGHPGCDDFAVRMLNYAISGGDLKSAYRWAQRATLLPDQDCQDPMVKVFTAIAESQLSVSDIDEILASPDGNHNRDFLLYTRFLALAKEDRGRAIKYFDEIALSDKHSLFARARSLAADCAVPEGIRGGADGNLSLRILVSYPKRSKELAGTQWEPEDKIREEDFLGVLNYREREVALRTRLARKDSIKLDPKEVAWQYRILLELHNVEQMEKAQANPSTKADLRYKQASIVYHNRGIFFPVWARHHLNYGYSLNQVRFDGKGDERLTNYAARTFYLRRAYDLFISLLKDYPEYKGADKVLFSAAKCYAKLMDYRPAKAVDVWTYPDAPPEDSKEGKVEYGHRRVAELFRRVIKEFPDSSLADDAERAATYREKMARSLRLGREKEEKRTSQESRQEGE